MNYIEMVVVVVLELIEVVVVYERRWKVTEENEVYNYRNHENSSEAKMKLKMKLELANG